MKKFGVFSGFLGSGKTTTLMALTRWCTAHLGQAAMICNDLGRQSLADNKLARLAGCSASELTGNCICYMTPALVARLDRLFQEGCQLVLSDIPGFGVGALEHVYHTLHSDYPGRYELAPFTVLVEPSSLALLQNGGGDIGYILNAQLLEADLIVLNKQDLLSPDQCRQALAWLQAAYPQAQVLPISAQTGAGIPQLCQALVDGNASLGRPDLGYGGQAFCQAMGRFSEIYLQYYASVCCNHFDGNAYLHALARAIGSSLREKGWDIPHLKLLAWEPEGDYGKVDLLGVHRPPAQSKCFSRPCTELAVMLNGSAVCPSPALETLVIQAVEAVSLEFDLTCIPFQKACFGMA